jgi:hypothetical protein
MPENPPPVDIVVGRKDDKIVIQTMGNAEVPANYIVLDAQTAEQLIVNLSDLLPPPAPIEDWVVPPTSIPVALEGRPDMHGTLDEDEGRPPPPSSNFEAHINTNVKSYLSVIADNPLQIGLVLRFAINAALAVLATPHWSGIAFTAIFAFDAFSIGISYLAFRHEERGSP